MKKETKKLAFEVKEISEDENYFTFEGYASTFGNIDLGGDEIIKGAFTKTLEEQKEFPILWQHSMGEPVGRTVTLFEDEKGLYVKAILPREDSLVKGRVMPQMKIGSIKEMSIGYFARECDYESNIRKLKEIELFEISLVTKAMNPKAKVTGYKSIAADLDLPLASRDKEWDSRAAVARVREFTNSEDSPSRDYRNYFMYFDGDNADKFTSYKLPFVDIIDNEAYIVPRAVFAIAQALEGARGGVDIPATDKQRVIRAVNSLYEEMADEFDDEDLVSPFTKKSFNSLKDVETDLKARGYSNSEAKTLIAKVKEFSNQRDAEEKQGQREAEYKEKVLNDLENFIKSIKK